MKGSTRYYYGPQDAEHPTSRRTPICVRCGRVTCGGFCKPRVENSMTHPEPYGARCDRCGAAWRLRRLDVWPHRGEDVAVPDGLLRAGCDCRALWMEAA